MLDGSDAIADWPILNALVNTAAGATWVSFHHGGGVGIGYSLHAGMATIVIEQEHLLRSPGIARQDIPGGIDQLTSAIQKAGVGHAAGGDDHHLRREGADIVRRHGADFCRSQGNRLCRSQRRVLSAIDARTGNRVWQERTGGGFTASPVAADGKIYLINFDAEVAVVNADDGKVVNVIPMENDPRHNVRSSVVAANGKLFIRTNKTLFCIGG